MNPLIQRMNEISNHLKQFKEVKCLLGLGSLSEVSRLDEYSDLDFFLIVENDYKEKYIDDLSWLRVKPIVFQFKNSNDGHKILYEDGIYAEFAVFTAAEIIQAKFSEGRVYYNTEDFDLDLIRPRHTPLVKPVNIEYHVNEALTNLFIGLKRMQRGELSNATTFIQVYAYNLVIPLLERVYEKNNIENIDLYVYERRIEKHFPNVEKLLSNMRQGYLNNKESAKAILDFLTTNFKTNDQIVSNIRKML